MSQPTAKEIARLKKYSDDRDDEAFHSEFDDILEEKLMELDPEWMKAMQNIYGDSKMDRWCA